MTSNSMTSFASLTERVARVGILEVRLGTPHLARPWGALGPEADLC